MNKLAKHNARSGIAYAFRQLIKELIWYAFYRHTPDPKLPSIAIFSSRRGGSTLLMEILASNPGISFSDQPFSLYTATRPQLNQLPIFSYSQIMFPDPHEWEQIQAYLHSILSGNLTVNGPWKFWQSPKSLRSNRMVLKITDAKTIATELVEHFGLVPVIVTRHPISQSLSVQKNGWDVMARAYLRNTAFVDAHLSSAQVSKAEEILGSRDPIKIRVLDWTLENLPLIAALKSNPDWLYIPYESLILHPTDSIEKLASFCRLTDKSAMLQQLALPSRSTKYSSTPKVREEIAAGNRSYILSRWRQKVDPAYEAELLDIPTQFGLNLYQTGRDEPNWYPSACPALTTLDGVS